MQLSTADSNTTGDTTGRAPQMKSRQAHTEKILSDDVAWLESRIDQLQAAGSASERRLAVCYRKLLRQRRRQLASLDGTCPGCWQDYFC